MKFFDIQQNTDEWLELRKGHFTASAFNDLFLKTDTAGYKKCIARVLYEKKTGQLLPEERYTSKAMENGHIREQEARSLYEIETFTKVKNGGFCELNDWVGCSPDGLIGNDGMLQIKCPEFSTIVEYKITGKMPINYLRQMQGELWVTGRKWNDYFVYFPKIEPFTIHLERDKNIISEIESKVNAAIFQVESYLKLI
jgi:putative phage-type endonuclease